MNPNFPRKLPFPGLRAPQVSPEAYFHNPPTLETPRLLLRKMRMRDAQDVFRWSSDEQVARYVFWTPHHSLSETRSYIRALRRLYRNALPASWAIEWKQTHQVIGTIGFMSWVPEWKSAEVGYSLSREFWNRGIMSEALARVIRSGFDDLKLNRIEAQFDLRNAASGRVMEKCGMRREGVLRQRIYNKGEFVDVAVYAVLASDPLKY